MNETINTPDIKAALCKRFPSPEHALLWEVGNATGARQRRWADALAMCLYPSRGLEISGIEIKVSRSDWQRELENVEKSAPVQKYCDRWWVAAPKKLIDPSELPSTWGLLELTAKGALRVAHQAPLLEAAPVDRSFMAAVLRRASEADEGVVNKLVAEQLDGMREGIERKVQRDWKCKQERAERVLKKAAEIQEATGIDLDHYAPTERTVAALRFAMKVEGNPFNQHSLTNLSEACERLIKEIQNFSVEPEKSA